MGNWLSFRFSRAYKYLVACVFLLVIAGVFVYLKATKPSYLFTDVSPDGKYKIVVYEKPMFAAMPGGGGDNMAVVILMDNNNRELGNVGGLAGESSCGVMVRDIEIMWAKEFAYYARGNAFNLKTGKACDN